MNPKTPLTETEKDEIKYLVSGASDFVEAEYTKRGKQITYNIEEIATVLKSGKKYVLPSSISRVNTLYDILLKLKKLNINASYAPVKGTLRKHTVLSKNKKEYFYTTAQYFLFVVQ